MTLIALMLSSYLLGLLGAWIMSLFANRLRFVDYPTARSSHSQPTPKGGGVGIFAAFLLSVNITGLSLTFWLPICAISALGFFGDRKNLSPQLRLYSQLFHMGILVVTNSHFPSNLFWSCLLVLFWTVFIVGTANFFNFMDGINGLAGISGFFGFGLLAGYIFIQDGQSLLCSLAICLSLACLGFLPLNLPKAKIFMGDIGSILLGAAFAGLIFLASKTYLDFLCMTAFLFPFYADVVTTMLIRLRDGESLAQPHRRHIYQFLANEKGIAHWKISLGFGLVQLLVSALVILVKPYGGLAVFSLLIIWFVIFASVSFSLRAFGINSFRHRTKLQT